MCYNASRPLRRYTDLPNSRAGCNADDLSSLTSLAPSDKDGNVVLKLALRAENWLRDATLLKQTLMCPPAVDLYYAHGMASG